ncbi:hypothetical protein CMI45_01345 [Candidatus Pacearchaeota archaeon]|nr:hypothetical protein [Candidatus Pacearchaeota archaeon]
MGNPGKKTDYPSYLMQAENLERGEYEEFEKNGGHDRMDGVPGAFRIMNEGISRFINYKGNEKRETGNWKDFAIEFVHAQVDPIINYAERKFHPDCIKRSNTMREKSDSKMGLLGYALGTVAIFCEGGIASTAAGIYTISWIVG